MKIKPPLKTLKLANFRYFKNKCTIYISLISQDAVEEHKLHSFETVVQLNLLYGDDDGRIVGGARHWGRAALLLAPSDFNPCAIMDEDALLLQS